MQPKSCCVALHLPARKGLDEDICNHAICGTVNELKYARVYCLSNEMITNVDMFGSCMEVVSGGKHKCRLVVTMKCGWSIDAAEQLADKSLQPDAFLCSMHGCNILGFGS